MAMFSVEKVLSVHHWTDAYFSFTSTRNESLRFESGQFIMIGLMVNDKPLMRAYSIASPAWEDSLDFFSIKVQDGPLTSLLQNIKPGDDILIGKKPTGTLVATDLNFGKNLFLFSTGTGLAPFLSIVRDPDVLEKFEKVILVHGVRHISDLAYRNYLEHELLQHEYLGEMLQNKFMYYPVVSREDFVHYGRITDLIASGKMCEDLGLPPLNPKTDRAMLCGSQAMLKDVRALLDGLGFSASPKTGIAGDYLIERAFVS